MVVKILEIIFQIEIPTLKNLIYPTTLEDLFISTSNNTTKVNKFEISDAEVLLESISECPIAASVHFSINESWKIQGFLDEGFLRMKS